MLGIGCTGRPFYLRGRKKGAGHGMTNTGSVCSICLLVRLLGEIMDVSTC